MIVLKVPYAEKDEAKALGARWNKERKVWYVPDGADAAPFKRWVAPGNAPAGAKASALGKPPGDGLGHRSVPDEQSGRVDSYTGKTSIGAHYLDLGHDCNPFIDCPECAPKLQAAGWTAQHALVKQLLAGLRLAR